MGKKKITAEQAIFNMGGTEVYNRKLQTASENLSKATSTLHKTKASASKRSGSGRVVGKKVALTFTPGYKMQTGSHQNNTEGNFSGKAQITAEGFGTFGTYKGKRKSNPNPSSTRDQNKYYRKKKANLYDKVEVTSGTETNLDGTPKVTATYAKTIKKYKKGGQEKRSRTKEISGKQYRRKKEKVNKQLTKGKFDAVQSDYRTVATPKRTATRQDVKDARKGKRVAKKALKDLKKYN